jgi:diacylglycerol kinase (ATP)
VTRRAVFIVNPASANGSTGRVWPDLAALAAGYGVGVETRMTEAPGHATELAREAAEAGAELVVAVGGDGTVHEVVNGLVGPGGVPVGAAALGVVARGTGRDFIRSHAIPSNPKEAIRVVAEGTIRMIDAGEVMATDDLPGGRRFANHASAGVTGAIARRANEGSKRLGGTPTFLVAAVQGFRAWTNTPIHLEVDGRSRDLVSSCVVCMLGHSLAGGMKVAKGARQDDGLLDMILVGDASAKDLALNVHRIYTGDLASHPLIDHIKAVEVVVSGDDPLPIEADGELAGSTPATFRCLRGALRLVTA